MGISFKFKKQKNWKKLRKMLDKKVIEKIIKKHVRRATLLNGKILEKHMRGTITKGSFQSNALLTQQIKNEDKPLIGVGTGAILFKAITSKVIGKGSIFRDSVFVGVLRENQFYNIAKTIHDGKTVKVTDKMRGLFVALAAASRGELSRDKLSDRGQDLYDYMNKGWKPLKKSTTKIVIPPRQFVLEAFEDGKMRSIAKKNWQQALAAAYAELKGLT